jgi:ParB-like chromosome segregation protein Spo0J
MKLKTTADLAKHFHPSNPRMISNEQLRMLADSMKEFGDLSGLVFNRRTGNLVGGHQRIQLLDKAPITITRRYPKPTNKGTTAEGFVVHQGERFTYRVVDWDANKEMAAMIAANKHGGDWDELKLKEVLSSLKASDFENIELTGFDLHELERVLAEAKPPDDFPSLGEDLAVEHKCPKCGYVWSGKAS